MMKSLVALTVLALIIPNPLLAQTSIYPPRPVADDGPPAPSPIACSYNEEGNYVGAGSANPDERARAPVKTDGGWRWVVDAKDGTGCPRRIDGKTFANFIVQSLNNPPGMVERLKALGDGPP